VDQDRSVSIATSYGLEGPEIQSRWGGGGGGEIFRTRPDWTLGPPSQLYKGYRVIPRGKTVGSGVDIHPI